MNKKCLIAALAIFTAFGAFAQQKLKGKVVDQATGAPVADVFVHDINSRDFTITDKRGDFTVRTEKGHLLVFQSSAYVPDTLYVLNMHPGKIRMAPRAIALKQVNINAPKTTFDPRRDYPEVYEKSKLYILSPSTWFSKQARDARRLKREFKREEQQVFIDSVFSRAFVAKIIPLKGKKLSNFMALYRPDYDFARRNQGPLMVLYLNKCYEKYKALPPDKRAPLPLDTTKTADGTR